MCIRDRPNAEEKVIGSYRGFELSLRFDTFRSEYQALLKGQRKYTVSYTHLLSKIDIAYPHATDEDIPIQVNVDLVGYRVERYLGCLLYTSRCV